MWPLALGGIRTLLADVAADMYLCMYIPRLRCVSKYTQTCIHTYLPADRQTDRDTLVHVYIYIYIRTCIHVYIHVHVYICMRTICTHINIHACMFTLYISRSPYKHTYTHAYIDTYTYMYIYICMYIYVCRHRRENCEKGLHVFHVH